MALPSAQQLGGLGRDAMKVIGTIVLTAGSLSLIPQDQAKELLADLQHLKNAASELLLAFTGSGGLLALGGIFWSLIKNTAKSITQSAAAIPDTLVITTPIIAESTPQNNIVSNASVRVVPK